MVLRSMYTKDNMIKRRYLNQIKKIIQAELPSEAKVFIFGSAVTDDRFHDIDIGIEALADESAISSLRDTFEQSNLPYHVDVIDFNHVDQDFEELVMKGKVLWLT